MVATTAFFLDFDTLSSGSIQETQWCNGSENWILNEQEDMI